MVAKAGRGRFAAVSSMGPDRARDISDMIARAPLLTMGSGPVRSILCGVLAGEDLRLNEISTISEGVRSAFGNQATTFELATVNDEETFSGRISVVLLLFEANAKDTTEDIPSGVMGNKRKKRAAKPLGVGPQGRGRFNNAEPTIWNSEDLDIPTYLRRGISLDV